MMNIQTESDKNIETKILCANTKIVLAISALLSVASCAILTSELDRYHERILKDDMRAMARSVRRLQLVDNDLDLTNDERHERVMGELELLEGIAEVINDDSEIYYSVYSPYMGSLLHDISMAREFAEGEPSDYQPAVGLIRSCMFCHQKMNTY